MRLGRTSATMHQYTTDQHMSKPTLREQQVNVWAEYPGYPKADWRDEVMHNDTHLG
jgi:hypothetical protein